MATGTVKTVTDKGFGFISMEGSADIFFHNSEFSGDFNSLRGGEAVTFELSQGDKGPKATQVALA